MKATDADLARVALAKGLISRERHDRVLAEADRLQALGLEKSVGEILVEDGSLTADAARSLREALGWTVTRPRIGGYEIVRRVGIGGMGTVFEARHVRLNQRIALKVLFPRLAKDPRLTERFIREARALAKLDHPHLVHAIDAGQDGEHFYLAMEFIEGENLLQRLARGGPLDPVASLDVIRSVCEALSALEERGLVHRDVKPGNILIGAAGQVKLADLGLLMGLESSGQADPVCGTPHYMAPEQIRGTADLDARTDLYALGATWYHMVVGRPPFVGTRTAEILDAHLSRDPPLPGRLRRGIPAAMERVILRWLSKDKDARPRSTRAAIEDVDRLAASLRKGRLRSLARTVGALRPRRRAAILAAACVLAGAVVLAFSALNRGSPGPSHRPGSVAITPLPGELDAPPRPPLVEPEPAGKLPAGAGPPADMGRPSPALVGPPLPKPPPSHATLDLPVTHEAAEASVAAFLTRAASRLGTAAGEAWRGLSARAGTFEPLIPLCRSFHAEYIGIEPGRSPPAGIALRYTFESAEELLDFRAEPGSWEVREGELRGLAVPEGEPLESVAWYAPPVRLEWRLPRDAPLILGLGSLRAAPGAAHDARVWTQAGDEDISVLAAPRVPAGPGWLEIGANGVEVSAGGRTAYIATRVPPRGRISLRIAAQHAFSELSIEAVLDPSWGAARAAFLREHR